MAKGLAQAVEGFQLAPPLGRQAGGKRGEAARTALYLFDRDAGVALLRSG